MLSGTLALFMGAIDKLRVDNYQIFLGVNVVGQLLTRVDRKNRLKKSIVLRYEQQTVLIATIFRPLSQLLAIRFSRFYLHSLAEMTLVNLIVRAHRFYS